MSLLLALKLVLVPLIISIITLAGRKWGPSIAGWLSAFPVVAGPILVFIAAEQGAAFAQSAATGTLLAILSAISFGLSYAWMATRYSWILSLLISMICYFSSVFLLNLCSPSLISTIVIILIALLLAPYAYPSTLKMASSTTPSRTSQNDMFFRMGAGIILVLLVTHYSSHLGAHLSGLFAMFPVMASVLTVFTHRASGAIYAIHLLRGMVLGYYAFACFCLTLILMLTSYNTTLTFLSAFSMAALIQGVSRYFLKTHKD